MTGALPVRLSCVQPRAHGAHHNTQQHPAPCMTCVTAACTPVCRNYLNRNDTTCDIVLLPFYHAVSHRASSFLRLCCSAAPLTTTRTLPRCLHRHMHSLHHGSKCARMNRQHPPPRCSANRRDPVKRITACTPALMECLLRLRRCTALPCY